VCDDGYKKNPEDWKAKVKEMVNWCAEFGVYALIDWHVLSPGDSTDSYYYQKNDFFDSMASYFKNYENVLYVIANEPNGSNV